MTWGSAVATAAILLTASLAASPALAKSKRIQPSAHAGQAQIRVGAKLSEYHLATRKTPAEFRVKGPVTIRVLSRYVYPSDPGNGEVSYKILADIGRASLPPRTEKTSVSDDAKLENGDPVGALERSTIRIPDGDHKVRIYPEGEGQKIALRVFRGSGKKKISWVAFAPQQHAGAVRLHAGDTEYTYYRMKPDRPISATFHGPLRLKATSRLDFVSTNGYTQAYVLKVLLDGKEWKTFPLKSKASHTSTYPERPETTPGRGQIINLEVPNGTHTVTFQIDGTTAPGASLRISVARRDLRVG